MPQPPQQPPPQTQPAPPPTDPQALEHAALSVIVLALLSGATLAVIVKTVSAVLAPLGIRTEAVEVTLELVYPHLPQQQFGGAGKGTGAFTDISGLPVPRGSARAQTLRTGVARQAAFVVASSRRITVGLEQSAGAPPLPPGPPDAPPVAGAEPGPAGRHIGSTRDDRVRAFGEASRERIARVVQDPQHLFPVDTRVLDEQLVRERRFFGQHLAAERARREAAARVDAMATKLGVTTLGWEAVMDSRTTPDCARLHHTNFEVTRPPNGTYPGTLHGGLCRCRPHAMWPGQPMGVEVLVDPTER